MDDEPYVQVKTAETAMKSEFQRMETGREARPLKETRKACSSS